MVFGAQTSKAKTGGPVLDTGRGVVAVFVVYVLMLYQLPLAPLLAHVLHPADSAHAPCTSTMCHCLDGCACGHHTKTHHARTHGAMDHAGEDHDENPSLRMCGTPGATALFVLPVLDKAFLSESDAAAPHRLPPLTYAGSSRSIVHTPVYDIFHPPRLG